MKNLIISASIFIFSALILSACSKEAMYTCKCKISGDETTMKVYEKSKKSDAKSDCKKFEKDTITNCSVSKS